MVLTFSVSIYFALESNNVKTKIDFVRTIVFWK